MTILTPEEAAKIIGNNRIIRLNPNSSWFEDLKKNLFVALEMSNGYTEEEALKNWECENGKCQCP